jgi:hypothetical protein
MLEKNDFLALSSFKYDLYKKICNSDDNLINRKEVGLSRTEAQIVYHLSYYESIYFNFMIQKFLHTDGAQVDSFIEDKPDRLDYSYDTMMNYFNSFYRQREENLNLLLSSPEIIWKNTIIHSKRGELKLQNIIDFVTVHDKHHLEQLLRLLQ